MTDTPHIDDRRRFKELWQELLFARVLVAAIVGGLEAGLFLVTAPVLSQEKWYWWAVGCLPVVTMAIPSAIAKKGWTVYPLAACTVLFGLAATWIGAGLAGIEELPVAVIWGVPSASLGLAEGLLDRSVATAYCGLLGGALFGAAAAIGVQRMTQLVAASYIGDPAASEWIGSALTVGSSVGTLVGAHVGIGLSLALGRYIRDLSKRKQ